LPKLGLPGPFSSVQVLVVSTPQRRSNVPQQAAKPKPKSQSQPVPKPKSKPKYNPKPKPKPKPKTKPKPKCTHSPDSDRTSSSPLSSSTSSLALSIVVDQMRRNEIMSVITLWSCPSLCLCTTRFGLVQGILQGDQDGMGMGAGTSSLQFFRVSLHN